MSAQRSVAEQLLGPDYWHDGWPIRWAGISWHGAVALMMDYPAKAYQTLGGGARRARHPIHPGAPILRRSTTISRLFLGGRRPGEIETRVLEPQAREDNADWRLGGPVQCYHAEITRLGDRLLLNREQICCSLTCSALLARSDEADGPVIWELHLAWANAPRRVFVGRQQGSRQQGINVNWTDLTNKMEALCSI